MEGCPSLTATKIDGNKISFHVSPADVFPFIPANLNLQFEQHTKSPVHCFLDESWLRTVVLADICEKLFNKTPIFVADDQQPQNNKLFPTSIVNAADGQVGMALISQKNSMKRVSREKYYITPECTCELSLACTLYCLIIHDTACSRYVLDTNGYQKTLRVSGQNISRMTSKFAEWHFPITTVSVNGTFAQLHLWENTVVLNGTILVKNSFHQWHSTSMALYCITLVPNNKESIG